MSKKPTYEELREKDKLFKTAITHSPIAMVVSKGIRQTVTMVNDRFTELFGYTQEDIPDVAAWWPLAYPDKAYRETIRTRWNQAVEKSFSGQSLVEPMEVTIRCKDGTRKEISVEAASVGEVNLVAFIDMTERRQAEYLREKESALLQAIIDNIPIMITRYDPDANMLYLNNEFEKKVGWTNEEVRHFDLMEKVYPDPEYRQQAYEYMQKASTDWKEFQVQSKYGRTIESKWSNIKLEDGTQIGIGIDITERKQTEKALRDLANQWQSTFDAVNDSICVLDSDWKILQANRATSTILSLPPHQILGSKCYELLHGKSEPISNCPVRRIPETGKRESEQIQRKGRWLDVTADPIFGDDGTLQGVVHIISDITEEKRRNEALTNSEETLNSIFKAAPIGIGMVCDRTIVRANDRLCEITGRSSEELLGKNARILYPTDEDYEYVGREKYKQIMKKGTGTVVTRWQQKQGEIRDILLSSTPIDRNDWSAGVTFTALDITDWKNSEKNLVDAHEMFKTVLNSIDATVYVADMNSHEILFMNQFMIDSFGRDMTGEICWDAFRSETGPCAHCTNDRLMDENGEPTGVHVWQGQNPVTGKWYINHDRAIKWTDGRYVRIQIASDITPIKQMEKELNQAQKMEAIGTLAGGVAHDFNNMLSVIIGQANMALEEVGSVSPLYERLKEIEKAAERSADLTHQLLAFARKQTISPKVIDLNKTVEGMFRMLKRIIGEDIELAWMPGREVWPVKMDPSQIDQILANLCVNARDAIADVGKITIETDKAIFGETCRTEHLEFLPGEFVLLAVSDNGSGMDANTQANIFEPFFTTKESGRGTGLGLATVYGIVKQNNGFIDVYSEQGRGTTFKIYLPRYRPKAGALQETAKDRTARRGNETVLLVEDEEAILRMTSQMLDRLGYDVVAARTPGEAVRLAQEYPGEIHLLLTDVIMPEMNGRDLAKNILSIYPDLKRLFMSGYTANVIAHHGVLDEGVNFIQKPFSIEHLSNKVREALDKDPL